MTRLAALLLLAFGASSCTPEPRQPNVLLILVDTLRADRLGGYGYGKPTSPALDRFLDSAVVFEDAQSAAPWTLPSVASLLTSLLSSTHGCWQYNSPLHSSYTTLPEILTQHGYHTEGVVSHVFLHPKYGIGQGFAEYDVELVTKTTKASHEQITSPELTRRALAFLDRRAADPEEQPWFFMLHYFDPHDTYKSHDGITAQFGDDDEALYDGEIAFTDQHIAQVLDRLDELGMDDDTIVAFVADHGEEFNEHGRERHGKSLFTEVVHVPFALRVPGVEPRRVAQLVSTVDFAPTLLELLDLPRPDLPMAGRSLVPALRGEELPARSAISELRLRLRKDCRLESFATERWKIVREIPKKNGTRQARNAVQRTFLFDRINDPAEAHDVAAEHPDVVAKLERQLAAELEAAEAASEIFTSAEAMNLTEAELERLRALGYVGGGDESKK